MSSAVIRIGVLVLALAQLGVAGFYAPVHRLQHHTLHSVDVAKPLAPIAGCRSGCCHHHAKQVLPVPQPDRDEQAPHAPCPDDESHCVWCVVALHHAAPTTPMFEVAVLDLVEFLATPQLVLFAARPATAFDVRGPPAL